MPKKNIGGLQNRATCPVCLGAFRQPIGSGKSRTYCTPACQKVAHAEHAKRRLVSAGACCVDCCKGRATRVGARMCEKHFSRIVRRKVEPERKAFAYRYLKGEGYVALLEPGHPLAGRGGHVYEHRAVVYAAHGYGPCPTCHWCGCGLDWRRAVVDHLNEIKDDNRLENLVVSCNKCNRARGAFLSMTSRILPERVDQLLDLCRAHAAAERKIK